nr:DNA-formamidopyrimidine glycosylase family protein [Mycobacterium sp.]
MPELPDVEGFRRELATTLPRRRIRHVTVKDPGILRNTTAKAFARRLDGHRFATPSRHGKWLMLPTDGPTLLIHSGMTGHPYYAADGADEIGYERLVISLDKGELRYADLRKLAESGSPTTTRTSRMSPGRRAPMRWALTCGRSAKC